MKRFIGLLMDFFMVASLALGIWLGYKESRTEAAKAALSVPKPIPAEVIPTLNPPHHEPDPHPTGRHR